MAEALTYDELRIRLGEQIELLQLSAENFDKGYMATTLNMATAIRVLFHDTSSSISVIKQICEFDKVDKSFFEMISTKEAVPGNPILVLHGDGLYYMTLSNSGVTCIPKLNNAKKARSTETPERGSGLLLQEREREIQRDSMDLSQGIYKTGSRKRIYLRTANDQS